MTTSQTTERNAATTPGNIKTDTTEPWTGTHSLHRPLSLTVFHFAIRILNIYCSDAPSCFSSSGKKTSPRLEFVTYKKKTQSYLFFIIHSSRITNEIQNARESYQGLPRRVQVRRRGRQHETTWMRLVCVAQWRFVQRRLGEWNNAWLWYDALDRWKLLLRGVGTWISMRHW